MKSILVPSDLSQDATNTLKYAISLSVKSNTKLFFYIANINNIQLTKEYALKHIKNIFKELNLNFDNIPTEIIIDNTFFSNPQITTVIEEYSIDLAIIGSSNQGLKNTFFDSPISELIDTANCPILSIPHDYIETSVERIGYATELYDLSERIKEIIPFVRKLGASIEAFHVYPVYPQNIDVINFNIKNALSLLREEIEYDKVNLYFIKTASSNETVLGIREFIKIYKPDILVMYHSPRMLFDKLVMDISATMSVVKVSTIPILILNQKTKAHLDQKL
jgi:hypothetical protein